MNKFVILFFWVVIFSTTSCRVKKGVNSARKIEKTALSNIPIQKDLKKEINSWLGTPYKYGGITKKGVDCSGFVNAIYQTVYDIDLPRTSKEIYSKAKAVKLQNIKEGDLIFFNYEGKGVSHVGIYLADNKYAHASASKGVVISDITDTYARKKIVGVGRIR